jgi:hypothetical protein
MNFDQPRPWNIWMMVAVVPAFMAAISWAYYLHAWGKPGDLVQTTGTLVSASCEYKWSDGTRGESLISRYAPAVSFDYLVNGQAYRGRRYSPGNYFGDPPGDRKPECEALIADLKKQPARSVWYSKSDPTTAFLSLQTPIFGLPIVLTTIAGALLLYGFWVRHSRPES